MEYGILLTDPTMAAILRAIEKDKKDYVAYHDGLTMINSHVKAGETEWLKGNKMFRSPDR